MTCSMADGSAPVVVTRLATQVEMIVNALLMMMCNLAWPHVPMAMSHFLTFAPL